MCTEGVLGAVVNLSWPLQPEPKAGNGDGTSTRPQQRLLQVQCLSNLPWLRLAREAAGQAGACAAPAWSDAVFSSSGSGQSLSPLESGSPVAYGWKWAFMSVVKWLVPN